jgi:hypothetical protein
MTVAQLPTAPIISTCWLGKRCGGPRTMPSESARPTRRCRAASSADAADGGWPQRARKAASAAHTAAADHEASRLELLLGDLRNTFDARRVARPPFDNPDEIPSKDLVEHLVGVEGRPWCEMGRSRKPMTQNRLARMLKPLGITPGNVGPEDARVRGYERDRFKEAFDRYLDFTEGA